MKDVTELVPRLQRKGRGVPVNMATLELRDAVRAFLTMAGLWTDSVPFFAVADQKEYTFDLSKRVTEGDAPVVRKILQAKYLGTGLAATSYRLLDVLGIQQFVMNSAPPNSDPQYAIGAVGTNTFTVSGEGDISSDFEGEDIVTVLGSTLNDGQYTLSSTEYTAPDFVITVEEDLPDTTADGKIGIASLALDVELKPANGTTQFPDFIVDTYEYALVGKAASELFSLAGRPYFSPDTGRLERIEYNRGIVNARTYLNNLGTTRDWSWVKDQSNTGGFSG